MGGQEVLGFCGPAGQAPKGPEHRAQGSLGGGPLSPREQTWALVKRKSWKWGASNLSIPLRPSQGWNLR